MRRSVLACLLLAACSDDAPLGEVTDPLAWVDPRIGTGGLGFAHGSCFVGAVAPHGIAKPGPDTNGELGTVSFQHYSGYFAEDDRIRGFSSVHMHGTGATDYGVLSLMPTLAFDANKHSVVDYETAFDKKHESASAGLYRVQLANGISVELTASQRTLAHRYTFPKAGAIVVDLAKVLDGGMVDSASITVGTDEFSGQLHHLGGMSRGFGGYTLYFAARGSAPWTAHHDWQTGTALEVPAGSYTIAIGLSFTSVAAARANLDAEYAGFDETVAATRAAWTEKLGVIKLTGGTREQRRTFYTSLYHAFMMPSVIDDANGDYRLANGTTGTATGYRMMSDLSLWDTYRTVSSLYAWLAPDSARDQARSLVTFGTALGAFPKWPVAIGESGVMLGASAEIVIADAVARGVANTGAELGWPVMRAAAMDSVAPPGGRGGRGDVELYMQLGYVPATAGRSVSTTTEYAHDDFALAQLAGALGHTSDRDALLARSHGWRMLYDPKVGFLRSKNPDGTFPTTAFDPLDMSEAYAEANAWQSLWMAGIHDPDGIAQVLGGNAAAVAKLQTFFEMTKLDWETADESAANFPRPYYWAGNEPDINAPFLFAQLGRADLTQEWTRWIVDTIYSDQPNGVPGNDDGGTMGAWYVFATLGLYPIAGTDRFVVGAPVFPRARITASGHELVIEAEGSGKYVRSVDLDGVPLDMPYVTQPQLATSSRLHFVMSTEPAP